MSSRLDNGGGEHRFEHWCRGVSLVTHALAAWSSACAVALASCSLVGLVRVPAEVAGMGVGDQRKTLLAAEAFESVLAVGDDRRPTRRCSGGCAARTAPASVRCDIEASSPAGITSRRHVPTKHGTGQSLSRNPGNLIRRCERGTRRVAAAPRAHMPVGSCPAGLRSSTQRQHDEQLAMST